jgi:hypothetical protein
VTTASDVSALATIAAGGFTPLFKTLLWERDFATSNFEGMTFGIPLANGATSLVLISDNGGGISQDLYALQVVPEPGSATVAVVAATLGIIFVTSRCRRGGLPARRPPR